MCVCVCFDVFFDVCVCVSRFSPICLSRRTFWCEVGGAGVAIPALVRGCNKAHTRMHTLEIYRQERVKMGVA